MSRRVADPGETLDYDPEAGVYRARYDRGAVSPSVAVVWLLEAITGTESAQLDPLYESVDPESLDRLLTRSAVDGREGVRSVEFAYSGHAVRLWSDGTAEIRPSSDDDREAE